MAKLNTASVVTYDEAKFLGTGYLHEKRIH